MANALVKGTRVCPYCSQEVCVINDNGEDGDERFNYLENHPAPGKQEFCEGSEKLLAEL